MLSLYFHIPFCEKKCNYCSFYIIPKGENYLDLQRRYLDALIKEISFQKEKFQLGTEKIYTIYFGGGTPSEFGLENLLILLERVSKEFDLSNLKEFSFELNPKLSFSSNEKDTISFIKSVGDLVRTYNLSVKIRFSIGIQSLEDKILSLSNRNYNLAYIEKLLEKLSTLKVFSFNLDFISFGLEENIDMFGVFVSKYKNFIDSYSVYTLELFPGSIWQNKFKTNEDRILDNFSKYKKILLENGYKRYEISNFAKKGKESLHNQVYWNLKEYLGFGTSASGFVSLRSEDRFEVRRGNIKYNKEQDIGESNFKVIRYTNSYAIQNYINNKFEYKEFKILTKKQLCEEKVFLGLRTSKGIVLTKNIEKILDIDKLAYYKSMGYIIQSGNKLFLTDKGFDVYNYILTDLLNF